MNRLAIALTASCIALILAPKVLASSTYCAPLRESEAPICSKIIDYPVMVSPSQTIAQRETLALSAVIASTEQAPKCGFYHSAEYQCRKHFPRCVETPTGPREQKMCVSTCMHGPKWRQRQCRYFSEDYFVSECAQTAFYSEGTPDWPCDDVPLTLIGEPHTIPWRSVAAGVMMIIAAALGGSALLGYLNDRKLSKELDQVLSKEMTERAKAEKANEVLLAKATASGILSSHQSRLNQMRTEEYARQFRRPENQESKSVDSAAADGRAQSTNQGTTGVVKIVETPVNETFTSEEQPKEAETQSPRKRGVKSPNKVE